MIGLLAGADGSAGENLWSLRETPTVAASSAIAGENGDDALAIATVTARAAAGQVIFISVGP
jgi:hypothetical protein